MRAIIALLLCAALCQSAAAQSGSWTRPKFCKTLDCPMFSVVKTLPGGVELRKYQPATWVSTDMYSMSMQTSSAFMTLFNYIDGGNADKAKIPMTVPVLVKVVPGEGPYCNSNFTQSFFLPYKFQGAGAKVPAPTNRAAYIQRTPELQVYVLPFSGWATDAIYRTKATELSTQLKAAGIKHDVSTWWTTGYNSPYDLGERHNEIWLKAL